MRSKYGNVRCYVDGAWFASKREAAEYLKFKALKQAGEVKVITLQPRFKFPCGITYVADFEIEYKNGDKVIYEIKGWETNTWKMKQKMFKIHYPNHKLVVIK